MPPASLSTLAVMNPGPMTARTRARRLRHPLRKKNFMAGESVVTPEHADHIVGGDDAGDAAVLVDDRQRDQVVLVEERRDFAFRCITGARHVGFAERAEGR